MFLSGCGHDTGNCSFIPVIEYDAAFTSQFATELHVVEDDSATIQFVADSIQLRDAVKACKGEKP